MKTKKSFYSYIYRLGVKLLKGRLNKLGSCLKSYALNKAYERLEKK